MFRPLVAACSAAALLLASGASPAAVFHAPRIAAQATIALEAPAEKRTGATVTDKGLLQIGFVRPLEKSVAIPQWNAADGGYVARVDASSAGAQGLRVKLELGTVPGTMEVRAMGADGVVEAMTIDPWVTNEAWTPWTPGEAQTIEIYSRVAPSPQAIRVGAMVHFTDSPLAKAAASCTLSTACSAADAAYDAAIGERKKSLMRIQFVDGGGAFVCSATLIDTPSRAPFVLTANHCINNVNAATSINALWFYEETSCGSNLAPTQPVRSSGGMQLVFTNFNIDSTLLMLNSAPPGGAVYAPLNPALLTPGQAVVSVSHPRGDMARYAIGTAGAQVRDGQRPIDMYRTTFSRGIIEPGSSGSGLYTLDGAGRLELRAVLSQAAVNLSCTNPTAFTLYARLEAFYPEIAQYIGVTTVAADDAPNRPQDLFLAPIGNSGLDVPLDQQGPVKVDARIDYAGDVDVYRFFLANPAVVTVFTEGPSDTVGTLMNSAGTALEANDDVVFGTPDNNFGITRKLEAGAYYVGVGHWDPQGTGPYSLRLRTESADANNYTDLWWNPAESGWGLNVNHQGHTLFATLFTYEASGSPTWLVMSNGALQRDGSYQGDLFQLRGTPFNAASWAAPSLTPVGTMKLAFTGNDQGSLAYTFNGTQVVKTISRQVFASPVPSCKWSAFDRSFSFNFQDLWWNPAESGWGLNLTQQGGTLFATLFVYGADGKPQWYVMSAGTRSTTNFLSFSGKLYRTAGPAFNASPWTAVTVTEAGTMNLDFTDGRHGTLAYTVDGTRVVKAISRQVFSSPATDCDS